MSDQRVVLITGTSSGVGTWEGPISFRKPATFGLSFGAVLFAVIWQLLFLKLTKRMHILAVSVFAIACALQTALICLQAW